MKILYIASGSIHEPLIESQVLRYLEKNAQRGCAFDLITFERQPTGRERAERLSARLEAQSINWMPRAVTKGRRSLGMIRDIRETAAWLGSQLPIQDYDLVHCRSFLPGNIGRLLKKRYGLPLLYDMRGFWAREKFAYGHIRLPAAKWFAQKLEDRVVGAADHLVSLTDAGIAFLRSQSIQQPITCIPCCVDLEAFVPLGKTSDGDGLKLVSVGSLGRGYRCDAVLQIAAAVAKLRPGTTIDLISRTDPRVVEETAKRLGIDSSLYKLHALPHEEVAPAIAKADAGVCMVAVSEAKIASCPTKLGEYLACGLPVIANIPIGDVEATLKQSKTGVTVELDRDDLDTSAMQLCELIEDRDVGTRARETAERTFSVADGAAKYFEIYQSMTKHDSRL